jgi:hypothetical protein
MDYRFVLFLSCLSVALVDYCFCSTRQQYSQPPTRYFLLGGQADNSNRRESNSVPESVALRVKFQYLDAFGGSLPCVSLAAEEREQEIQRSRADFANITGNNKTYRAILEHFGLQARESLNDDKKLIVYCVFKKLASIEVARKGSVYRLRKIHEGAPKEAQDEGSSGYIEVDDEGRVVVMGVGKNAGFGTSVPLRDLPTITQTKDEPDGSAQQEAAPVSRKLSFPRLRYKLLQNFQVAFCYPIRPALLSQALEVIRQDKETYGAIMQQLGLTGNRTLSLEEQRAVYQEYLRLSAIELELLITKHEFALRISNIVGEPGSGKRIFGIVDDEGRYSVLNTVPVSLSCPR